MLFILNYFSRATITIIAVLNQSRAYIKSQIGMLDDTGH